MFYFWIVMLVVMFGVALFINPWAALFIGILSLVATG